MLHTRTGMKCVMQIYDMPTALKLTISQMSRTRRQQAHATKKQIYYCTIKEVSENKELNKCLQATNQTAIESGSQSAQSRRQRTEKPLAPRTTCNTPVDGNPRGEARKFTSKQTNMHTCK